MPLTWPNHGCQSRRISSHSNELIIPPCKDLVCQELLSWIIYTTPLGQLEENLLILSLDQVDRLESVIYHRFNPVHLPSQQRLHVFPLHTKARVDCGGWVAFATLTLLAAAPLPAGNEPNQPSLGISASPPNVWSTTTDNWHKPKHPCKLLMCWNRKMWFYQFLKRLSYWWTEFTRVKITLKWCWKPTNPISTVKHPSEPIEPSCFLGGDQALAVESRHWGSRNKKT